MAPPPGHRWQDTLICSNPENVLKVHHSETSIISKLLPNKNDAQEPRAHEKALPRRSDLCASAAG